MGGVFSVFSSTWSIFAHFWTSSYRGDDTILQLGRRMRLGRVPIPLANRYIQTSYIYIFEEEEEEEEMEIVGGFWCESSPAAITAIPANKVTVV